jgi:hypothetical protein
VEDDSLVVPLRFVRRVGHVRDDDYDCFVDRHHDVVHVLYRTVLYISCCMYSLFRLDHPLVRVDELSSTDHIMFATCHSVMADD